ncbi:Cytosolic carboxypeptidase-like protein 5 [Nowakowskiella sp. JEL0407]|nr:Cytosolic carboxypeptidase-like protein 5 [Nowakowskiella sp. JEL0407]
MKRYLAGIQVDSDFDSGNLADAQTTVNNKGLISGELEIHNAKNEKSPDTLELQLWTRPDGTMINKPNKNKTWFYFSIEVISPEELLSFIDQQTVPDDTSLKAGSLDVSLNPFSFTSKDTFGTLHNKSTTSTISFSPKITKRQIKIKFHVMNLNKVQKLFMAGMRPLFRVGNEESLNRLMPGEGWESVLYHPTIEADGKSGDTVMTFECIFTIIVKSVGFGIPSTYQVQWSTTDDCMGQKVFFSYCLPYSYTDLQRSLSIYTEKYDPTHKMHQSCAKKVSSQIYAQIQNAKVENSSDIYFHRECLGLSVAGLRLDLITVSSSSNFMDELHEENVSGIFPSIPENNIRARRFNMKKGTDTDPNRSRPSSSSSGTRTTTTSSTQRINDNAQLSTETHKKFFFISARVHPSETVSSYIADGFLEFILRPNDPRAKRLREMYVFKIIPMVNPDGVSNGNYRGDNSGTNLNRVYASPDPVSHPTIHAIKTYLTYLSTLGEIEFYIDLHGHANRFGCFLFGNHLNDPQKQIETITYAKIMELNCPWFEFGSCDFSARSMSAKDRVDESKEGCGRVAIYKALKVTHCYTFENNYFCSKSESRVLPPYNQIPGEYLTPPCSPSQLRKKKNITKDKEIKLAFGSLTKLSAGTQEKKASVADKRIGQKNQSVEDELMINKGHKFSVTDLHSMGRSLAISALDICDPTHSYSRVQKSKFGTVNKIRSWASEYVRGIYFKEGWYYHLHNPSICVSTPDSDQLTVESHQKPKPSPVNKQTELIRKPRLSSSKMESRIFMKSKITDSERKPKSGRDNSKTARFNPFICIRCQENFKLSDIEILTDMLKRSMAKQKIKCKSNSEDILRECENEIKGETKANSRPCTQCGALISIPRATSEPTVKIYGKSFNDIFQSEADKTQQSFRNVLQSTLISHVTNESIRFTPPELQRSSTRLGFQLYSIPNLAKKRTQQQQLQYIDSEKLNCLNGRKLSGRKWSENKRNSELQNPNSNTTNTKVVLEYSVLLKKRNSFDTFKDQSRKIYNSQRFFPNLERRLLIPHARSDIATSGE